MASCEQDLGAADYQLLKTSREPLYQQVYRGLEVCPNLDSCITHARDTRFAFITWRLYLEDRIAIKLVTDYLAVLAFIYQVPNTVYV